jgi:hypothetical protein
LLLDGAGAAGVGHVTVQLLPVLHGGEGVLQPLRGRAAIDVLVRQIDEVLLAKAAFQFSARCHRLGQRHADVFKSYDDIVDHCCYAWNTLVDRPWKIMSIGLRQWAHRF